MKHTATKEGIISGGGCVVRGPGRERLSRRDKVIIVLLVYLHLL